MAATVPDTAAPPPPAAPRIEQHGISLIPEADRRGRPRDLGWLWAGTNLNVQTVVYGSFLPFLGLSFTQSVVLIVLGNLTWAVVGYASLQGPAAGTSIFTISRAGFGLRGGRVVAFLSWVTQVLYETTGLALVGLAVLALLGRVGVHHPSDGLKVAVVVVAAAAQLVLPVLGHRYIMLAQRLLVFPMLVLFVVLGSLTASKVNLSGPSGGVSDIFGGIALVLAGGSFAWVVNATDYSRYLPTATPRPRIVWAVALGGYATTTPLMILGAAVASIPTFKGDAISGLPASFPAWFVVPYLLFVIVQMYGINAIDLYSSSLSLQAVGLPLRQWQATLTDCCCTATLTVVVLFSSSFNSAISDIILFLMIWISPWAGVFLLDWMLRGGRYSREGLFASMSGPYWGTRGYRLAGLAALLGGAAASACCINTSLFVGPVARALGGSDLSIPAGVVVAAAIYWVLAHRDVAREAGAVDLRADVPTPGPVLSAAGVVPVD